MSEGPAGPDRAAGAIRLLFLIGGMDSGGAQTQARLLLESLPSRGVEAHLACYHGSEEILRSLGDAGVEVHRLPRPLRRLWPLQIFAALHRLVRRHRIQIVHAFLEDFVIIAPPLRLLQPRLAVVASRRSLADYVRPDRLRLMAWSARWASAVVANASAVAESARVAEGDPGAKLRVIRNGMPLPPPVPLEERARAREEFGVEPEAFVVAYPAHFRHGKGHARLPEVVRGLADAVPGARVLLAGKAESDPHYRRTHARFLETAERLRLAGNFVHLGLLPHSRQLLAASDVLLSFSESEGMSNSIMEAMAIGLPVVASDVGGTPELVRDGVDGWLIASGDTRAASERLVRLAKDPGRGRRMGEAGRSRIEHEFSVARMVEAYLEIYEETTGRRRGRRERDARRPSARARDDAAGTTR